MTRADQKRKKKARQLPSENQNRGGEELDDPTPPSDGSSAQQLPVLKPLDGKVANIIIPKDEKGEVGLGEEDAQKACLDTQGPKNKKKTRKAKENREQDEGMDDPTLPSWPSSTRERKAIKHLYGKVANTALPKGYESTIKFEEVDGQKGYLDATGPIITSVPSRYTDFSEDHLGHTEWLVGHPTTKAKVVPPSGQMQDFVTYTESPKHEVRDIPGMGKGVFATEDIRAGEAIFSERPLLVIPRNTNIAGVRVPSHYSIDDYRKVMMFEFEKNLEMCLVRMPEERKAAFLGLANSHREDGSGPLLGISRTNGYALPLLCDGPAGTKVNDRNGYSVICNDGSRINHSCQPNVSFAFFLDSFSVQFSANRPIKAGEQLFYAYCPIAVPKAARNKLLEPYDFQCQCPACLNATPASDKFRTEFSIQAVVLNELSKFWVKSNTISPDNPDPNPKNTFKRSEMKPVLQFMAALEKEGLQGTRAYAMMNMALYRGHMLLGEVEKAMEAGALNLGYYMAGVSGQNQTAALKGIMKQVEENLGEIEEE